MPTARLAEWNRHVRDRAWLPGARAWRGLVGILVVVLAAETLRHTGLPGAAFLPSMPALFGLALSLFVDGEFLGHVLATLRAAAIGLLLATLIGVPGGIALGSVEWLHSATKTLIEFLRPVPSVALIPLAIIVFGVGIQMKIALVVYASLWPILFNTIYGVHDVDSMHYEVAKVYGLPRWATFFKVVLPSVAPFVYVGVRVSAAFALVLAISAELLAGGVEGLGTWIMLVALSGAPVEYVYVGTLVAGLLGWAVNLLLEAGERRVLPWAGAQRIEEA